MSTLFNINFQTVLCVFYDAHMEFREILHDTHMKFLHYVNTFFNVHLDMDLSKCAV